MAEPKPDGAKSIRASLTKAWAETGLRSNCSGFLKAVAVDQGFKLEGQANDIIQYMRTQWTPIPSAQQAAQDAADGWFVVALLPGPEHADKRIHGHVAVVLPGALLRRGTGANGGSYPFLWCAGVPSGQSDGSRTVGDVWRPEDRNKVKYYKKP